MQNYVRDAQRINALNEKMKIKANASSLDRVTSDEELRLALYSMANVIGMILHFSFLKRNFALQAKIIEVYNTNYYELLKFYVEESRIVLIEHLIKHNRLNLNDKNVLNLLFNFKPYIDRYYKNVCFIQNYYENKNFIYLFSKERKEGGVASYIYKKAVKDENIPVIKYIAKKYKFQIPDKFYFLKPVTKNNVDLHPEMKIFVDSVLEKIIPNEDVSYLIWQKIVA